MSSNTPSSEHAALDPSASAAPSLRVAEAVLDELRAGLALVRAGRFCPPALSARTSRVFYPFGVVVALWRSMWADGALRRCYLRTMLPQVALVIAAGIAWVFFFEGVETNVQFDDGNFTVNAGEKTAHSLWMIILSLYTTMSIFEWIVIALTREHHDALSYAVSGAVGVPPEEDIPRPRVRLDVQWLVTKMKRRIQGGIILFVSVVPPGILISAVLAPIAIAVVSWFGAELAEAIANTVLNVPSQLFTALAGLYWLGVFTLGKTAHAWRDEVVDDPFFLRLADRSADRHPRLLGWLRFYARVLRRALGLVRRPAHIVERAAFETAGLSLLRIVISLPGVYVLLRPLIPVAATVVIAARSPQTLTGLPVRLVLEERLQ